MAEKLMIQVYILSMIIDNCPLKIYEDESSNYVSEIKDYIDNHFAEINHISYIAKLFHLHPNYLSYIFKNQYYVTPKHYLLLKKIDYANYLLRKTTYSIDNISYLCGFSNLSTFNRVYKKYMTLTANEYRKQS